VRRASFTSVPKGQVICVLESPANGKYFTKAETLERFETSTQDPVEISSAVATIEALFDSIEHAPISTLMFLITNRLHMINGETISCRDVYTVYLNCAVMNAIAEKIAMEHTESHEEGGHDHHHQ
jgi:hypothetical protein